VRVVVTGATGNVGTGLLRALVADPDVAEIVGIARRRPDVNLPGVTWVGADVATDPLDVFAGADAVIHLAWLIQPVRDEALLRRVNIDGTRRVLEAVRNHRVPTLIAASSVGAYSAGPKDTGVDESWPVGGISSSVYSRQKSEVESILAEASGRSGAPRIVRMRTSLVFSDRVASGIANLFLGPLVPIVPIGRRWLPIVPAHPRLAFQATHSDDIGEAYLAALRSDHDGPVNVAADAIIDAAALASVFDARPVSTPAWLLRGGAAVTHALRLQRTSAGWVDLALGVPTMDTSLAHDSLGWTARRTAHDALRSLLDGMADRAGANTPPLTPRRGGAVRPLLPHDTSAPDSEETT
jgi:UDP-glucose 4-epimerase